MTVAATMTSELARFVTHFRLADVPADVIHAAKLHILDGIGVAVASSGMNFGIAANAACGELGSGVEAHSIGFGSALPAASAALVNGTLIHGLEFDDTHIGAIYHATAPALAAALAVGEAQRSDGATVLAAYLVGVEVGCRLAEAGTGAFHDRGFHPTGIAGTFAAACVSAFLRHSTPEVAVNALGICGSQAAGILEIDGSWLKRMHPGWAAHSAIVATTLAQNGFRGPRTVLDGPRGLFSSHLGFVPSAEQAGLDTLRQRWMMSEIALKPYPCCHFTQAFVDAAFALLSDLDRHNLDPAEVDRIVCPTTAEVMSAVSEPAQTKVAPNSIYDALFSVQYAVALALVRRRVDLAAFYDDPLDDPEVLRMAAKVTCPVDALSDYPIHYPGEVQIYLANGTSLKRRVPAGYGTPEFPMTDADIEDKFTTNARRRLPASRVDRLVDSIRDIESSTDIGGLMGLLTA